MGVFCFVYFSSRNKSSETKSAVLKTHGKLKLFSFSVEEGTPPTLCIELDGQ